MGKSRLLARGAPLRRRAGRALDRGQQPLLRQHAELLAVSRADPRDCFGIAEDDDEQQSWSKLARAHGRVVRRRSRARNWRRYIGVLLALPLPEDLCGADARARRPLDGAPDLSLDAQALRAPRPGAADRGRVRGLALGRRLVRRPAGASASARADHADPVRRRQPARAGRSVGRRSGERIAADERLAARYRELAWRRWPRTKRAADAATSWAAGRCRRPRGRCCCAARQAIRSS